MNLLGFLSVAAGLLAFALVHRRLGRQPVKVRLAWLGGFALPAIPALLFATYYAHLLPDWAWFYTLRSWAGSEFLVVFLGCACGAGASLAPRWLLGLPLLAFMAMATVPYLKPVFRPLAEADLRETWQGMACRQSTASTCGPASVSTILRQLGGTASEREAARAAYASASGTEAWYLARYVRRKGLVPRFDFRSTFTPAVGLPAMVGVRVDGAGHFIAVLAMHGDEVNFADPLIGEERLPLAQFLQRYEFTGFHMVIGRH